MTIGRCLEEMNRHAEALAIFENMDQCDRRVLLAKGRCLEEMNRPKFIPGGILDPSFFKMAFSPTGERVYTSPFEL